MRYRGWERWGVGAGVVSAVLFIVGQFIGGNVDTGKPDAAIVSHFLKHSNQVRNIVSFFVIVASLLLFVVFVAAVREHAIAAEGEPARLTALVFGSGLVIVALLAVANPMFNAAGIAMNDSGRFRLDANTFRLLSATGYGIYVTGLMVGIIFAGAMGALAFRTGLLPRWYGWLSVVVAVIMIFSIFYLPTFVFIAWVIVTSGLLVSRRRGAISATTAPVTTRL